MYDFIIYVNLIKINNSYIKTIIMLRVSNQEKFKDLKYYR